MLVNHFVENETQYVDRIRESEVSAVQTVRAIAKKMFDRARGSHDWDHTLRVCSLCERLGVAEGADMDVLLIAAYLHDIGRCFQDAARGGICHAEEGAHMARPIIADLPLSQDRKKNILHCIRTHRFRGNDVPETVEAKVLFDADKLDAIGAIGVGRAFLFAGEVGARLHNPDMNVEDAKPYSKNDTGFREFKVKLCKIRDRMMTGEGRKLADNRHEFMKDFFNRFLEEYEGKR